MNAGIPRILRLAFSHDFNIITAIIRHSHKLSLATNWRSIINYYLSRLLSSDSLGFSFSIKIINNNIICFFRIMIFLFIINVLIQRISCLILTFFNKVLKVILALAVHLTLVAFIEFFFKVIIMAFVLMLLFLDWFHLTHEFLFAKRWEPIRSWGLEFELLLFLFEIKLRV